MSNPEESIIPRVSVLVPMFNAEDYIGETLTTLLRETNVPLEVIVINDQSTDNSLEVVDRFEDKRLRVVTGPGSGISECLNTGISAMTGDIFMRCDADDLYPDDRIQSQLTWLDQHPEYGAICGGYTTIDKSGQKVAELITSDSSTELTHELNSGKTRTHLCTFAIRKEVLEKTGSFRSYFETAEDIDYQLRLGEKTRVMYLPKVFYYYRLHDTSITHTQANTLRLFFEKTAREFQSQRKEYGKDGLENGTPPDLPTSDKDSPWSLNALIAGQLTAAAWREHASGNKKQAINTALRALRCSPLSVKVWKSLFFILVKPTAGKN